MAITTKRSDVIWNYIGTIVSLLSGFILLPLLMKFLSSAELGLWYVYIAIGNLAMQLEFGFNPTFARNIVYVVSGARKLNAQGKAERIRDGIDWHLLNTLIRASKIIYAAIAGVAAVLLLSIGSLYVAFITSELHDSSKWVAWFLFCFSITLNLYFLYSMTILRGYGDIAGENQAKTIARLSQLIISAVLLVLGYGIIGASIGYFVNAILLRFLSIVRIRKHRDIEGERKKDKSIVLFQDIKELILTVAHLAWRDGLVQIALYSSTQAMSIFCSMFVGLAETGMYSVLLQLANAVGTFATAYPKSFFPAMQSAFAEGDVRKQRELVSRGMFVYWLLVLCGALGICVVVLPLLPVIKPEITVNYGLFITITLYIALVQQHSMFCNYIISMNEIPYMWAYIVSALLGIVFVYVLCAEFGMGVWGIILGQMLSQIIYNNWKWPWYLCKKINLPYVDIFSKNLQNIPSLFNGFPTQK